MSYLINELKPGQNLTTNFALRSTNGKFSLLMQSDGNLCIYNDAGQYIWGTGSNGSGATKLSMQEDGNLVLYNNANSPVWASKTQGHFDAKFRTPEWKPTKLKLSDSGKLELSNAASKVVWTT